jgi:uncharacterized RDD family membrane protein YckC
MTFYKYAGFWRRLGAYTVDGTIIFFIFFILGIIASLAFFSGAISANSKDFWADLADPARFSSIKILIWIFFISIYIAYFTYFHGAAGRTPGKMLFGLQVVSGDGTPISFGTAFLRSAGYFISNIFYLGFIWVAFDKRKQGWHDKIAGTVVIVRERGNQSAGISIPDNSPSGPTVQPAKPPENNGD